MQNSSVVEEIEKIRKCRLAERVQTNIIKRALNLLINNLDAILWVEC
jgi:hypothetical protein